MAGFAEALGQPQQPPQQPAQGMGQGMGQPPKAPGVEQKPASPEQQQIYNRFVGMCMMMLWSENFMAKAAKMIKDHPDETDAMASIGAAIVQRVYMAADQQGQPIPLEVLVHGGLEVMQEVAKFAEAAGVQGIDDNEIETAFYIAADKVREALVQAGKADPNEMAAEFEQVRQAVGDDQVSAVQTKVSGAREKTKQSLLNRGQPQGEMA